MTTRILPLAALAILAACGQDQPPPPQQQEKSIGRQIGDSYKGMLDNAKQGVGQLNEQMQRTDDAVRERTQ